MWTYWGSKIDQKSDSMNAYWGSFLSVWEVLSPVFFTLVQFVFAKSHNSFTSMSINDYLTTTLKITHLHFNQIKSLKISCTDK